LRRPGYREAIDWIAANDDVYWLGDEDPTPCVTACLVCDLFGVDEARVVRDIRRALKRFHPDHEVLR
jgi:hypothetical protein